MNFIYWKPMVDEIRLRWNTLLPYIEKVAGLAQESLGKQETAQIEATMGLELAGAR